MNVTAYSQNNNYVITFSSGNHKSNLIRNPKGTGHSGNYSSRRRAFNRGSAILYCNQHKLTTFLTLTYAKQHSNYQKILNDIKNHFSRKGISYLAVVEKHKSGFYHIHMITSDLENVISLRKGKYSWKEWKAGFSDVKFLSGTDHKFRVELYLFKYLNKAEKIGGKYFLKSRDLTVKKFSYPCGLIPRPILHNWDIDFFTYNVYTKDIYKMSVERRYYYGINTNPIKYNKHKFGERTI